MSIRMRRPAIHPINRSMYTSIDRARSMKIFHSPQVSPFVFHSRCWIADDFSLSFLLSQLDSFRIRWIFFQHVRPRPCPRIVCIRTQAWFRNTLAIYHVNRSRPIFFIGSSTHFRTKISHWTNLWWHQPSFTRLFSFHVKFRWLCPIEINFGTCKSCSSRLNRNWTDTLKHWTVWLIFIQFSFFSIFSSRWNLIVFHNISSLSLSLSLTIPAFPTKFSVKFIIWSFHGLFKQIS